MDNPFNRPEPMTLIDLETENLTGYAMRSPSNFKTTIKNFGFYTLLVIIPLIVTIITTSVHIKQELKQIKIDFASEMKNTSMTFKDEFSKLEQDLNEIKIFKNGSYYEYYMNSSARNFFCSSNQGENEFHRRSGCM